MLRITLILSYTILLNYVITPSECDSIAVPFTFKEYQYKDSPKNVRNVLNVWIHKRFNLALSLYFSFRK